MKTVNFLGDMDYTFISNKQIKLIGNLLTVEKNPDIIFFILLTLTDKIDFLDNNSFKINSLSAKSKTYSKTKSKTQPKLIVGFPINGSITNLRWSFTKSKNNLKNDLNFTPKDNLNNYNIKKILKYNSIVIEKLDKCKKSLNKHDFNFDIIDDKNLIKLVNRKIKLNTLFGEDI